ncbi:hypothetical protein OROMI_032954 [Orobanche minor]
MSELVGPRLYRCHKCRNHVSLHDDIISKAFQWKTRQILLILPCNEHCCWGNKDRDLMTGLHAVADISCGDCNEVLGWKYERAYEASQKYKFTMSLLTTNFLSGKSIEEIRKMLQLKERSNLLNLKLLEKGKYLLQVQQYHLLLISGSLARKAIKELMARGLIRMVSAHSSQQIYTRATNT